MLAHIYDGSAHVSNGSTHVNNGRAHVNSSSVHIDDGSAGDDSTNVGGGSTQVNGSSAHVNGDGHVAAVAAVIVAVGGRCRGSPNTTGATGKNWEGGGDMKNNIATVHPMEHERRGVWG